MRRLLVIDANVTASSPSMRGWLASVDSFKDKFDEIEIWAQKSDWAETGVSFRKTGDFRWAGRFSVLAYLADVRRRFRELSPAYLKETLVQCTGCVSPVADVRFIHFWNIGFMEAARSRAGGLEVDLKERVFRGLNVRTERGALRRGATGGWWCVSRGVAGPIIRDDQNGAVVRYLPNAYDDKRFNPGTRASRRAEMRSLYGFTGQETVFCFCGYGHFERKGLRQAAAAVHTLARGGHQARLMVIGGRPEVIAAYKRKLAAAGVDVSRIVFTGMVTEMEKHMSAADALLFPSHFEAFSLAEIEAAALGLRLYLTDHPGNEMILREGVNGRLLPWEVEGMAGVLEEEIRSGAVREPHQETGEALTAAGYRVRLGELFTEAIDRKWPGGS